MTSPARAPMCGLDGAPRSVLRAVRRLVRLASMGRRDPFVLWHPLLDGRLRKKAKTYGRSRRRAR